MSVVIETTIGDITVDLFVDERPISCLNFIKLCKIKYYNYNLFHTIERGFIAQTGDPTGAGNGGSSIWGELDGAAKRFFEGETLPKIYHASAGLLSLVSAGKNLVGSQFFFTLAPELTSLDGEHCVIGEVVEGHETLRKLNEAIVDEKFRPYQDIRITHTVILEDPFPDPRHLKLPSRSPSPTPQRLQNGRIAADEDIDDTDGKTAQELQEMLAEREAKARATILEIVGDLPDAEMAPPENVLFVCKLNPVTTDDDLEIIFSRFGKVKNCEVIRDRKTGDSLQYAFVEFEEQKSCEAAYFKMDNVLIDDRRIHVDFSQSVAKVKWRGKGRGVEGSLKNSEFDNLREPSRKHRRSEDGESRTKRMSSKERQLARQERHRTQREQEDRDQKYRSNVDKRSNYESKQGRYERERRRSPERRRLSRSRSLERSKKKSPERRRSHDRRRQSRSRSLERSKKKSPERRRSTDRRRQSRSRSLERSKKKSPERRRSTDRRRKSRSRSIERSKKNSPERRRSRDQRNPSRSRSMERTRKYSPERRRRPVESTESRQHSRNTTKRRDDRDHGSKDRSKKRESERSANKNSTKSKSKRSKKTSTSSSDDSDSSSSEGDSDSTSTESSSDDSSVSSNEKRRQKRKHKVVKKKNDKSKFNKSKRIH